MEVHKLLADLFAWKPEYETKIAWEVWRDISSRCQGLLERTRTIHIARCKTGDIILQEVYDDTINDLEKNLRILLAVAPAAGLVSYQGLQEMAKRTSARRAILDRILDTGPHEQVQKEYEELLEVEIRLLDVADCFPFP